MARACSRSSGLSRSTRGSTGVVVLFGEPISVRMQWMWPRVCPACRQVSLGIWEQDGAVAPCSLGGVQAAVGSPKQGAGVQHPVRGGGDADRDGDRGGNEPTEAP